METGKTSKSSKTGKRLLGRLSFVSRTFEGGFKDTPYVLDMDANLYIGPADHLSRDEHSAVEVVYHFLTETGRLKTNMRKLLRNRLRLLDAFAKFDEARGAAGGDEFRIYIFGTHDGELLDQGQDDDLPAGPCGSSVNEVKRRFYDMCARLDPGFAERRLEERHRRVESRFAPQRP